MSVCEHRFASETAKKTAYAPEFCGQPRLLKMVVPADGGARHGQSRVCGDVTAGGKTRDRSQMRGCRAYQQRMTKGSDFKSDRLF